jgi:hypothetical protein
MTESWLQQIEAWHDFYVIVGSSAAGLTGLMFVVVSLRTERAIARETTGLRTFVTPTVAYFTTVLVVAAVMTMPFMTATVLATMLGLGSLGELTYMISLRGHQRWRKSKLDRMDWLFYVGLPILSYVLILAAAVGVWVRAEVGLGILGGTMILLLVIGIRNAWDLVVWMTQQPRA